MQRKFDERPSGALWSREKTSDKSPDRSGYLDISAEVLTDLVKRARAGEPIKLSIIAYDNRGLNGKKDWIKLIGKVHEERETAGPARRAPQDDRQYQRTDRTPDAEPDRFTRGHKGDDIPFDHRG